MKISTTNWKIYFSLILLCSLNVHAEEEYVLINKPIIANPSQNDPIIEFNNNGGSITYHIAYNNSCQFTYQMDWAFSKDINRLADGEEFSVNVQCTTCEDVCGFKWRTAMGNANGTNNLLSIPDVDNYIYNGNFEVTNASPTVEAWNPDTFNYNAEFQVKFIKDAPDSGFYLLLGDHKIIYHYVLEKRSTESCQGTKIDSNLDIHIMSADFLSSDIWVNLEFKGTDSDGDLIWRLKDYGVNKE